MKASWVSAKHSEKPSCRSPSRETGTTTQTKQHRPNRTDRQNSATEVKTEPTVKQSRESKAESSANGQNPKPEIQQGLRCRATTPARSRGVATPSFRPVFLRQERFDLLHLGGKKGLHVLALAVKLVWHLGLDGSQLVVGTHCIFINLGFKRLVIHHKALDLVLQGCESGLRLALWVNIHVGWELGQEFRFQSGFKITQGSSMVNWRRHRSGRSRAPRIVNEPWISGRCSGGLGAQLHSGGAANNLRRWASSRGTVLSVLDLGDHHFSSLVSCNRCRRRCGCLD